MSRPPLPFLLCAALLLCTSVSQAVIVEFTWTGNGGNSSGTTAGNWAGGNAPQLDGSELLVFPSGRPGFVIFGGGGAYGLEVTGHYHIQGVENSFTLGAGGLTHSVAFPNHLMFEGYLEILLTANQTWHIGSNARVEFMEDADIAGEFQITKTGAGLLDAGAENEYWSGGLQFNEGTIVVRAGDYGESEEESRALGTGTVTIGPDTTHRPSFVASRSNNGYDWETVILTNDFVLNGIFASKNETDLVLAGETTLHADTTFRTSGAITAMEGAIGESGGARKLIVDSAGAIVLYGSSGWTGGTDVTKGILIFGGEDNTPGTSNGILVGPEGYVGLGVSHNLGAFIAEINPASTGTLGFDSDPEGQPDYFGDTATLDLSNHSASLRLGSATSAILGGNITITPHGNNYRFGGGGGWLQVDAELSSPGSTLTLDSPAELPLTVRFTNTDNSVTAVSVTRSGAVFANGALPAGATLSVAAGAYLGTEDLADSATPQAIEDHIARFGATTGIIGFDIDQFTLTPATREIDLTGQEILGTLAQAYLGTASALYSDGEIVGPGVRFTGSIAPNSDGIHRFAAYKGGALEVSGTLGGSGLIIGHPDSLGAFGDRTRSAYSTVLLSGLNENKLANGVTLYGGHLMVGQAAGDGVIGTDHTHALGEGTLTIAPLTFTIEEEDGPETPSPLLSVAEDGIIISNPIVLNAAELSLGGHNHMTLTGVISGPGELYVGEDGDSNLEVTLSGANTFSGGVYVTNGATLIANSNTALGTGPLGFGGSNESEVEFTTTAPVIHGLESNDYGRLSFLADETVLTINQNDTSRFVGEFYSDSTHQTFRLVKSGAGLLRLERNGDSDAGLYGYGFAGTSLAGNPDVGMIIQQGTLVLGDGFYVEDSNSTIWVNGGTLALDGQRELYNPIVVDNGGRLAGRGTYTSSITIGAGATLSPGLAGAGEIGTLHFTHLELNSGGTLDWHIQHPSGSPGGGFDQIVVSAPTTLVINATPEDPFSVRVISLNSGGNAGLLAGLQPDATFAWALIEADSITGGFDPAKFALDVSQFQTSLGTGYAAGEFSLSLSGNTVMLNFTAVPEPSTYALMALGLGFVLWSLGRRRA